MSDDFYQRVDGLTNRYYQDRAWYTAMNTEGAGSGRKHWAATIPGTSCDYFALAGERLAS